MSGTAGEVDQGAGPSGLSDRNKLALLELMCPPGLFKVRAEKKIKKRAQDSPTCGTNLGVTSIRNKLLVKHPHS